MLRAAPAPPCRCGGLPFRSQVPLVNVAFRLFGPAVALSFGAAASAQTFSYPDFQNPSGVTLNGAAAVQGSVVRVTNQAAEVGSLWHTAPVQVVEGFETEFSFRMSSAPEGLAFVVQGSPAGAAALGGDLWGIGYGFGANSSPIPNSIAIEIDAVRQGFLDDTSANEVSIHTVGAFGNSENEGVSIARATPAQDLSNSQSHTLRVLYVPGTLEVFVDGAATPLLSVPFTFENGGTQLLGGNTGGLGLATPDAWVGFTSSTPTSGTQWAEIGSWNWISYSLPDDCYRGTVQLGSGGPYDVLTIDGGVGGPFRTVNRAFADPWTLGVVPPPGETSAPFLLLATLGIADASTVTGTPWGAACFPLVFPIDLGGAVAPVSLPLPPGLFLPSAMTFQAVMATDSSDPNVLELTNAIALQFTLAPSPSITSVTPNSAPAGAAITVNGNNFSPFAVVEVGGVPAAVLNVLPTAVQFAMPASVPCGATVVVRNPDGAQASGVFNPTPVLTNVVNSSGPASGGTTWIAIGTGLALGSTVTVGGVPANVTTSSATVVIATIPPGTPGPAQVVVTTPGGCTVTSTFTYL